MDILLGYNDYFRLGHSLLCPMVASFTIKIWGVFLSYYCTEVLIENEITILCFVNLQHKLILFLMTCLVVSLATTKHVRAKVILHGERR